MSLRESKLGSADGFFWVPPVKLNSMVQDCCRLNRGKRLELFVDFKAELLAKEIEFESGKMVLFCLGHEE
jgi:hypothetical protein